MLVFTSATSHADSVSILEAVKRNIMDLVFAADEVGRDRRAMARSSPALPFNAEGS